MKRILLIVSVLVAACAVSCTKETKVEDAVTIKSNEEIVPVEGGVLCQGFRILGDPFSHQW